MDMNFFLPLFHSFFLCFCCTEKKNDFVRWKPRECVKTVFAWSRLHVGALFHPLSTFFFICLLLLLLLQPFRYSYKIVGVFQGFPTSYFTHNHSRFCSFSWLCLIFHPYNLFVGVVVVVVETKYEHCMSSNKTHKIYLSSNKHKLKGWHTNSKNTHNKSDINVTCSARIVELRTDWDMKKTHQYEGVGKNNNKNRSEEK